MEERKNTLKAAYKAINGGKAHGKLSCIRECKDRYATGEIDEIQLQECIAKCQGR